MAGPRPLRARRSKRQKDFDKAVDKNVGKFPTFKHKQKILTKKEMDEAQRKAFRAK